jgi:hypothetical protein
MAGVTPDDTPGPSIEEELQLTDEGQDPSTVGAIVNNGGVLKGRDSVGIFDLRSGAGLSAAAHKALRDLIHFIDGGPADGFTSGMFSVVTGTVFPASETWYVAGAAPPAGKIVELTVTWTGVVPTTKVWTMYDTDGSTVLVTLTEGISYSGIFETGRARTWA